MEDFFIFERNKYRLDELNETAKLYYQKLVFVYRAIEELNARHAMLSRAKNAYIEDLKAEVIVKKSGVDVNLLFSED
jgi:hypothetical protein